MKMKTMLAAVASATALLFAAEAHAQTADAADWQGLYVGANIGGGWGDVKATDLDAWNATNEHYSDNASGVVGGLQAGYDWRFNGNWVLGAVIEGDYADVDGKATSHIASDTHVESKVRGLIDARARLGYVFNEKVMVYGTAGVAEVNVETKAIDTSAAPPFSGVLHGGDHTDWQAQAIYGAGAEYKLNDRWTIGAEYLHADLDDTTVTALNAGGFPFRFRSEPDLNVARVTLNYSF